MRLPATTVLYVCAIAFRAGAQEPLSAGPPDRNWATLHERAVVQFNESRFTEALAGFEAALPLAATAEQQAMTISDISYALSELGLYAEAIAQFERSLAAWRDIDPAGPGAIRTSIRLAKTQQAANQYAGAERTLRTALEAPRDHESAAAVLNTLGDLLNRQSRLAEARDNFTAALNISRQNSENRVNALLGLADVDRCTGRWQVAIDRSHEALALARDGNDPALEALALQVLGDTYADAGDHARAEPLLKRALAIFERIASGGAQHAATLTSLGVLYAYQGKNALAEDAFSRALSGNGNAASSFNVVALQFLAVLLSKEKRFREAGEFANRAWSIARTAFGEENPAVASALTAMAFVEEHAGNLDNAERHYAEAVRIMRKHDLLDSSGGLDLMTRYGIVLRKLHRGRAAKSVTAELKSFRSHHETSH